MRGKNVEHLLAVIDAAARLDLVSEYDLLTGVVQRRDELKSAVTIDGPAGERAGDVDHVLLRVAAVHAERVQLEQLAPVVFVEAARLFLRLLVVGWRERRG